MHGSVAPAPVSPLYKLGLTAVALMMVLLPVLYLAIIAATAYAVYDHAVDPWFNLENASGVWGLLAYLTPLVVGVILVFFMIKPLFARRVKLTDPVPVTAEEEPELFRFIDAVCDLVKAPRPTRVRLDLRVNASASFRRGVLSLFGRDLTLTIGLPLVAGLNVRELGGVLAHEFGHFAQGAGMRLTFIVRSVNAWFARLVYERDAWDHRLDNAAGRVDFRIGIILQIARGAVWLSRRILWALMTIGHGISCFMLRQMEFDADRFETQVAGTDAFASTTRRLHLLNIAWQRTLARQQDAFVTKRLVNDLPRLVALETTRLPGHVEKSVEEALVTSKTGWFDTHPSDRDRVQASEALATRGVLTGDAPATALFRDFAVTAQQRTESYYRDECGIELKEICLHSLDEMSTEAAAAAAEDEAVAEWFGSLLTIRTLITLSPEELTTGLPTAPTREVHTRLLEQANPAIAALLQADLDELTARKAAALLDAGFTIKHKEFGLQKATRDAAGAAIDEAKSRIETERAKLAAAIDTTRQRLAAALRGVTTSAPESAAAAETQKLLPVLAAFEPLGRAVVILRNSTAALELLLVNAENANGTLWNIAAQDLADAIERSVGAVLETLGEYNYPFPHARGVVPLKDFLTEAEPHEQRTTRAYLLGSAVLERSLALHYRIIARLAVLTQQARSETLEQAPREAVAVDGDVAQ